MIVLPKVLWQYIASWLQGDKAIIHLRATCRWLRRVEIHRLPQHMERHLTEERLKSVTTLRHLNIYHNKNVMNEMLQKCTNLEWLDASYTNVTWFPSTLRYLNIRCRRDVTNEMIKSCTHLEWLDVTHTYITWFPSTLRHLDICGCRDTINEMIQGCVHLEWLDAARTKITQFPRTLKHLRIFGRKDITNEMLAHLTDCEILR